MLPSPFKQTVYTKNIGTNDAYWVRDIELGRCATGSINYEVKVCSSLQRLCDIMLEEMEMGIVPPGSKTQPSPILIATTSINVKV